MEVFAETVAGSPVVDKVGESGAVEVPAGDDVGTGLEPAQACLASRLGPRGYARDCSTRYNRDAIYSIHIVCKVQ